MKYFILLLFFISTLFGSQRIISLSPSITEIIYALGSGDDLVATSSYSLYPKEAQKLPVIGGYLNPNLEKIIALRPTLVIGQTYTQNILKKLHTFHIKTLSLNLETIQSIQDSITLLGTTLHRSQEAHTLTNNITNAIDTIQKPKHPHSVLIVYGLKEDLSSGIYVAGKHIFFDEIITLCGNTNAFSDTTITQPVLGYENIIALNPDQIIILHSHATESQVDVGRALAAWYALPTNASRAHNITILDEDYLHIPSHRIALTIKKLSEVMQDD